MEKLSFLFLFLPAVLMLLPACGERNTGEKAPLKVGLVFDVGGRGDKSFNDSAYSGVERAKKDFKIYFEYIEPGEGSDRETALRQFASQGFDLIFGIGFMFTDDINHIAADYPKTRFACVDYAVDPSKKIPDNVEALKFREQEGSFLVGAIAALVSKSKRIGFVGGMDIPLIHKFEAGYKAGAKTAAPGIQIYTAYAGVTGEAFKNPAKGKEIAISQYDRGADVIYHASGSTGLGVFEAARERNKLAIGVDADQYFEAPGFILTSMIKRVDESVYRTIKDCLDKKFSGGIKELGIADDSVGYVYDNNNKNLIPAGVIKKIEILKKEIIAGKIKVPAQ